MIGSRAIGLLRNISRRPVQRKLQQVRFSHNEWNYRTAPKPEKWAENWATGIAVVAWWWFYWNLYHGWPHLIGMHNGHFLKNPRDYTDEELGIPPDDE